MANYKTDVERMISNYPFFPFLVSDVAHRSSTTQRGIDQVSDLARFLVLS